MDTQIKDMALFEDLWKECEPSLRGICNRKLSSYPSEIDDVIGDTYLALCNAVSKGVEIENPKAWLYGTLNNIIKLKYAELDRKKKTYMRLERVENELFYDVDFDSHELSDEVLNSIKDEIVEELLDCEKTLLILLYEKKLKIKEISVILNTTEAAIKQKHYRLKRKIKLLAKEKIKNFE